jgi:hypothetical protein
MCNWAEVDASGDGVGSTFTRNKVGVIVRLSGNCPRCTHPTMTQFSPTSFPSAGIRTEPQPVTLYCRCGNLHEGHPEGDNSCGAFWTMTVRL